MSARSESEVPPNKEQPGPASGSEASPSEYESEEEEHEKTILLAEIEDKNSFLLKIGVLFIIYFLFWVAACVYITVDVRDSRMTYRSLNFRNVMWIGIALSLAVKVAFGLFGAKLRSLAKIFYYVDVVLGGVVIFILYFFVEESFARQYVFAGIYVVLASYAATASAIGFTLSTLLSKNEYNPVMGIIMMTVLNIIVVLAVYFRTDSVLLSVSKLITLLSCMLLFNIYIAYNSVHVITYRTEKYFNHDTAWAFFCYWTDWFSEFWIELLKSFSAPKKHKAKPKPKQNAPKPAAQPPRQEPRKTKLVEQSGSERASQLDVATVKQPLEPQPAVNEV